MGVAKCHNGQWQKDLEIAHPGLQGTLNGLCITHTHTHLKALRLWPKPSLEDVVVALLTAAVFLFLGLLQGSNNPREVLNSLNKPNKSMPVANGADLPGVAVQCF